MRATKSLFIVTLILCCNSAFNQHDDSSADCLINEYMTENHVPGLACAVVIKDKMNWSKAYGMADVGNNIPMSTNGIMNIASISKTITATAVMQLWENGTLSLEEDINVYLPFCIRNPHFPDMPITLKHLLTHTSSITDGSAYGNSYSCGDPETSLKDWIANYLCKEGTLYDERENFTLTKPGEQHQYSNVGYGLIGYIVEVVTDTPFSNYCQEYIFGPLGMERSGWFLSEIDISNHVLPYFYVTTEAKEAIINNKINLFPNEKDLTAGEYSATCLYSFPNYPDGLLRTSIVELSYFLTAYMNSGNYNNTKILKQSTIDKMLSLQIIRNYTLVLTTSGINFL